MTVARSDTTAPLTRTAQELGGRMGSTCHVNTTETARLRDAEPFLVQRVMVLSRTGLAAARRLPQRIHRDERGVISVLSVFAIFLFTILLMLIVNTGRQIDDKLRMQNAADAAAYSGGVCLARGMNAIAFSNHLLCEVFALTAYMREARDRNSDQFIPAILAAWQTVGEQIRDGTQTAKFRGLGTSIVEKVPIEQQLADAFSEMAYLQSQVILPQLEYILAGPDATTAPSQGGSASPLGGFIPRFQRAVVLTTPQLSQVATDEIASRYGERSATLHENQPLVGVLWTTAVQQVGTTDETDVWTRTLPALDPSPTSPDGSRLGTGGTGGGSSNCHFCLASSERRRLARQYLNDWVTLWQSPYFEYPHNAQPRAGATTAKMSNYTNLFRMFACGQLDRLLTEDYPETNLPHVLREIRRQNCEQGYASDCWSDQGGPCDPDPPDEQAILERDYTFVAAAYWPPLRPLFPGLFSNPLARDAETYALTFAQTHLYMPRRRYACCPWAWPYLCLDDEGNPRTCWVDHYDNWPRRWDLFTQNWTVKLVPATTTYLQPILSTHPGVSTVQRYQAPRLFGVGDAEFRAVNFH